MESALLRMARQLDNPTNGEGEASTSAQRIPDIQVTIRSEANLVPFRDLTVSPAVAIVPVPTDPTGQHPHHACSPARYRHQC